MSKFRKDMVDSIEKGNLLKNVVKIVDALGKLDPDDYYNDEDINELITKAVKLRKHKFWNL